MAGNQHLNQVQKPLPLLQLYQQRIVANHGEALVRDYVNHILAPMQPPTIYPHFG